MPMWKKQVGSRGVPPQVVVWLSIQKPARSLRNVQRGTHFAPAARKNFMHQLHVTWSKSGIRSAKMTQKPRTGLWQTRKTARIVPAPLRKTEVAII
mmetsp:Transcript_6941/g.42400  ORF Transcript_6941/g.42400 Transcript_6941/m.42400 type:complete len:96 (-) Transcript_6941:8525-8812(-)